MEPKNYPEIMGSLLGRSICLEVDLKHLLDEIINMDTSTIESATYERLELAKRASKILSYTQETILNAEDKLKIT